DPARRLARAPRSSGGAGVARHGRRTEDAGTGFRPLAACGTSQGMAEKLSPVYDASQVEGRWYAHWRDKGYFQPQAGPDPPPFAVVLPPPKLPGRLHMGHALTATVEDCIVRWKRMCGYAALWLPGTDHAGIATQVMVERQLEREGTSRLALGREAF